MDIITATLSDVVQMTGDLSAQETISAGISAEETMSAVLTVPEIIASPEYNGEYTVVPRALEDTEIPVAGYRMREDLTVTKVPYYETSNISGETVYIASEVN